jgi:hypothetical protein
MKALFCERKWPQPTIRLRISRQNTSGAVPNGEREIIIVYQRYIGDH